MSAFSAVLDRYRVSSDPLRSERKVELAALILTVLFVLLLLYCALRLSINYQPEAILPAPETLQVGELQFSGLVSEELSAQVRARPIFWPSRRPVVSNPDEQEQAVATEDPKKAKKNALDKVKVLGVFGSGGSAVIIALVDGKKKRISLGDKVVGWTLDSIDRGRAVFSENGRSQTLALKHTAVSGES